MPNIFEEIFEFIFKGDWKELGYDIERSVSLFFVDDWGY